MNRSVSVCLKGTLALVCSILLFPSAASATLRAWTGSGVDSNWFTAANWSPSDSYPTNGDDAVIAGAYTLWLTNSSDALNSFAITNATLLFTNANTTLTAVDVSIGSGATLTHVLNMDTNGLDGWQVNGAVLIVCTNLTVATNGAINADARGWRGGVNAFTGYNAPGYGPGGSPGGTYGGAGAGYGGSGGRGGTEGVGPVVGTNYGSATEPDQPGSGAGAAQNGNGTMGGGLIRILASNKVTVRGAVTANAQDGGGWTAGGSGGGIYILCRTIEGDGTVRANGGNGSNGGGVYTRGGGSGAGGRVAISYNVSAQASVSPQPAIVFQANSGTGAGLVPPYRGEPGTLYFPDTAFFPSTPLQGGQIVIPGFTNWSINSLTLANGQTFFPAGFQLTVTNDLIVGGTAGFRLTNSSLQVGGNLTIDGDPIGVSSVLNGPNSSFVVGSNVTVSKGWLEYRWAPANDTNRFMIAQYLTITNGGRLFLYSGTDAVSRAELHCGKDFRLEEGSFTISSAMTNPPGTPDYGALVYVSGNLTIATNNAWIYPVSHPENGGSPLFMMDNLTIGPVSAATCGFNGDQLGYRGGRGGVGYDNGAGPGASLAGVYAVAGAGYGGAGGNGVDADGPRIGGVAYGSSNAPIQPGSGGGNVQYSGGAGGGGLVRIQARNRVVANGVITVDSRQGPPGWQGGGGSGGGIYITCKRFSGGSAAVMRARGGSAGGGGSDSNQGGGGGGGRIAVWRTSDDGWLGTVNVAGGLRQAGPTVTNSVDGAPGTVVWGLIPPAGAVIVIK